MEEQHTHTKKRDWMLPTSIVLAAVLIFVGLVYNAGKKDVARDAQKQAGQQGQIVQPTVENDGPVIGKAGAPVTIILYSDPSCPFCGAAAGGNQEVISALKARDKTWAPAIPNIIQDYVNTGKVRLVYKYFPGHGTGEEAMKVLLCANEQGKFWELHDMIEKNQDSVADVAKVKGFASSVGVNVSSLESCLSSKKYDQKLASDTASGQAAGVEGTPAFFVNDIPVVGAVSYANIKTTIDSFLK